MTIRASDIKATPLDEIAPNPRNRNGHSDEQITRLAQIIKYQGFRSPLIVSNQSGMLVSGHGRLMAAKKLGLTHVPVMYQDFENEDMEYAAMVSENSIASWAELDLSGINMDLADLGPDFELDLLGIKNFVLEPAELLPTGEDGALSESEARATLAQRFGVPPFSVLNAREGYWQNRKRSWIALGIQSELGRGGGCMNDHQWMKDNLKTFQASKVYLKGSDSQ